MRRRYYVTSKGTQCYRRPIYSRCVCFCTPTDFWSQEKIAQNWKAAMSCITSQRKQIKLLRKKNFCLRTKVAILEMLLSDVKDTC